jgi:hypothetical protein
MAKILKAIKREILDSRSNPTVEACNGTSILMLRSESKENRYA